MKATIFCIAIILFSLRISDAQHTPDTTTTMSVIKAPLATFLDEISNKTGISFSYINNQLPLQQVVSLKRQTQPLTEIFDDLFVPLNIRYELLNNKVILTLEKSNSRKYVVSGIIEDASSGEALPGASVTVNGQAFGIVTNAYGFYALPLQPGKYVLTCSFIGYETLSLQIELKKDTVLNIELKTQTLTLEEVVINASAQNENITSSQMSTHHVSNKTITAMPALGGEPDIIKSIQLLPGVNTIGEGSTGFFVRGGNSDQNLIILDEAPVYNPSHFLGFLSVFNTDAIKDVTLYKGAIPAEYGGRISSVLNIRMKEGNAKKLQGSGALGLLGGARLTIESPVKKGKGSFMVSGRRTFAEPFLWLGGLAQESLKGTRLFFYDLNTKVNYTLDNNNTVYLSGYFGRDVNRIPLLDYNISWGNTTGTARWNHLFSSRLFSNVTLAYSKYHYNLHTPSNANAFTWESQIQDINAKADFTLFASSSSTLNFGLNTIHHNIHPGIGKGAYRTGSISRNNALEHAAYVSTEKKIGNRFTANVGLRYSLFQNIGRTTAYRFNENFQVRDTLQYASGKIYHSSHGIEPRLSLTYVIDSDNSVKTSYTRMRQYLQSLSNSATSFTAYDVWYPSGPNIKPLIADQVSVGYFRNFKGNMFQSSVEVYYKRITNQIDYTDHASIIFNPLLEGELRNGEGRAYGAEFLIRKNTGKFTGWASYTFSSATRVIDDINGGKRYPALYNQPSKIALTASWQVSERSNISANWIYNSGGVVNLPIESFRYEDVTIPVYAEKNSDRLPDYHRLDFSMTLKRRERPGQKYDGQWVFSVYNVYARKNPLAIFLGEDLSMERNRSNPKPVVNKVYLFSIIPTISYVFKF